MTRPVAIVMGIYTATSQEKPKRTILYYPAIVPTGPWLRQALLYWDEIGSIVPEHWESNHNYPADILYLRSEGEFRAFRPETFIQSRSLGQERKSLDREFRALVSSALFKQLQQLSGPGPNLRYGIDPEKISHELYYFLETKGLVSIWPTSMRSQRCRAPISESTTS